ncbi:sodium-independent sulfate anion transporter-like [Nymphalis io]|uniref:sodium-independent sulfate anion transporter-like n=1 Tax=Inachis io TaxID=171585 RepID=UPI00216823DA|nr:sodium-independent sulfate anion transporter-like [Nymphalis io]XP_050345915.1 sodium-independent sulfate anion transporter-like [Nymphalis io]XP_050345916.1 sodium-independent sulfate anion transporter-like [Nymphalis io]
MLLDPRRIVGRVFPIFRWSRRYDTRTGFLDLIAGITVALTLIPQSIAYASLAGFEPQYGLYASFVGGFVYAVMGNCPQINIGPTALLSLLTFTYTNGTNYDYGVLLCFVGGIIQLIAGIVQLGFLVEFVSLPVVSGFTSAAAITIATSQIKGLLGLKFNAETFISTWRQVIYNIGSTRLEDTVLGLSCCIVLMGMKALKDIRLKNSKDEKGGRILLLQRSLWFAGISRNAIIVVIASVVAFLVHEDKDNPLILTGNITPGLPMPQLPPFYTMIGNTTISAGEMLSHLGSGLLVVPLVGIISNVAIAKAFTKDRTLDATQEIVALGACNIIGAFFRSLPVNGSFSRSAVSDASGVKTPAAGFYTGIIVLLTLGLLTPYFYFIPRAALSAVIVCAVLNMVDIAILKRLWQSNRLDLIPLLGTFVFCLALGVEVGLGCGVVIDILLLLYYQSRPRLDIKYVNESRYPPHYSIQPIGGLHFASAEKLRTKIVSLKNKNNLVTLDSLTVIPNGVVMNGVAEHRSGSNVLVVHCDAICRLDYTFLQSLKMLVQEWSHNGRVVWCDASPLIKEQLNTVIQEPLYCHTEELGVFLIEITMATLTGNTSDTRL